MSHPAEGAVSLALWLELRARQSRAAASVGAARRRSTNVSSDLHDLAAAELESAALLGASGWTVAESRSAGLTGGVAFVVRVLRDVRGGPAPQPARTPLATRISLAADLVSEPPPLVHAIWTAAAASAALAPVAAAAAGAAVPPRELGGPESRVLALAASPWLTTVAAHGARCFKLVRLATAAPDITSELLHVGVADARDAVAGRVDPLLHLPPGLTAALASSELAGSGAFEMPAGSGARPDALTAQAISPAGRALPLPASTRKRPRQQRGSSSAPPAVDAASPSAALHNSAAAPLHDDAGPVLAAAGGSGSDAPAVAQQHQQQCAQAMLSPRAGDIIVAIDGRRPASLDDARRALYAPYSPPNGNDAGAPVPGVEVCPAAAPTATDAPAPPLPTSRRPRSQPAAKAPAAAASAADPSAIPGRREASRRRGAPADTTAAAASSSGPAVKSLAAAPPASGARDGVAPVSCPSGVGAAATRPFATLVLYRPPICAAAARRLGVEVDGAGVCGSASSAATALSEAMHSAGDGADAAAERLQRCAAALADAPSRLGVLSYLCGTAQRRVRELEVGARELECLRDALRPCVEGGRTLSMRPFAAAAAALAPEACPDLPAAALQHSLMRWSLTVAAGRAGRRIDGGSRSSGGTAAEAAAISRHCAAVAAQAVAAATAAGSSALLDAVAAASLRMNRAVQPRFLEGGGMGADDDGVSPAAAAATHDGGAGPLRAAIRALAALGGGARGGAVGVSDLHALLGDAADAPPALRPRDAARVLERLVPGCAALRAVPPLSGVTPLQPARPPVVSIVDALARRAIHGSVDWRVRYLRGARAPGSSGISSHAAAPLSRVAADARRGLLPAQSPSPLTYSARIASGATPSADIPFGGCAMGQLGRGPGCDPLRPSAAADADGHLPPSGGAPSSPLPPPTFYAGFRRIASVSGHSGLNSWCVDVFPSGGVVLTGGDDAAGLRVWDARSLQLLCSLRGLAGNVALLTVSPDGGAVAAACDVAEGGVARSALRVWALRDGAPLAVLQGHAVAQEVNDIAWDPLLGGVLASVADDGVLRVWDTLGLHRIRGRGGGNGSPQLGVNNRGAAAAGDGADDDDDDDGIVAAARRGRPAARASAAPEPALGLDAGPSAADPALTIYTANEESRRCVALRLVGAVGSASFGGVDSRSTPPHPALAGLPHPPSGEPPLASSLVVKGLRIAFSPHGCIAAVATSDGCVSLLRIARRVAAPSSLARAAVDMQPQQQPQPLHSDGSNGGGPVSVGAPAVPATPYARLATQDALSRDVELLDPPECVAVLQPPPGAEAAAPVDAIFGVERGAADTYRLAWNGAGDRLAAARGSRGDAFVWRWAKGFAAPAAVRLCVVDVASRRHPSAGSVRRALRPQDGAAEASAADAPRFHVNALVWAGDGDALLIVAVSRWSAKDDESLLLWPAGYGEAAAAGAGAAGPPSRGAVPRPWEVPPPSGAAAGISAAATEAAFRDAHLQVWDSASGVCLRTLRTGHAHEALAVHRHPTDTRIVLCAAWDGSIVITDVVGGATLARWTLLRPDLLQDVPGGGAGAGPALPDGADGASAAAAHSRVEPVRSRADADAPAWAAEESASMAWPFTSLHAPAQLCNAREEPPAFMGPGSECSAALDVRWLPSGDGFVATDWDGRLHFFGAGEAASDAALAAAGAAHYTQALSRDRDSLAMDASGYVLDVLTQRPPHALAPLQVLTDDDGVPYASQPPRRGPALPAPLAMSDSGVVDGADADGAIVGGRPSGGQCGSAFTARRAALLEMADAVEESLPPDARGVRAAIDADCAAAAVHYSTTARQVGLAGGGRRGGAALLPLPRGRFDDGFSSADSADDGGGGGVARKPRRALRSPAQRTERRATNVDDHLEWFDWDDSGDSDYDGGGGAGAGKSARQRQAVRTSPSRGGRSTDATDATTAAARGGSRRSGNGGGRLDADDSDSGEQRHDMFILDRAVEAARTPVCAFCGRGDEVAMAVAAAAGNDSAAVAAAPDPLLGFEGRLLSRPVRLDRAPPPSTAPHVPAPAARSAWVHANCAAFAPRARFDEDEAPAGADEVEAGPPAAGSDVVAAGPPAGAGAGAVHCGVWINVGAEVLRGRALRCASARCGRTGAVLGCSDPRCVRSYHIRCAAIEGWRGWRGCPSTGDPAGADFAALRRAAIAAMGGAAGATAVPADPFLCRQHGGIAPPPAVAARSHPTAGVVVTERRRAPPIPPERGGAGSSVAMAASPGRSDVAAATAAAVDDDDGVSAVVLRSTRSRRATAAPAQQEQPRRARRAAASHPVSYAEDAFFDEALDDDGDEFEGGDGPSRRARGESRLQRPPQQRRTRTAAPAAAPTAARAGGYGGASSSSDSEFTADGAALSAAESESSPSSSSLDERDEDADGEAVRTALRPRVRSHRGRSQAAPRVGKRLRRSSSDDDDDDDEDDHSDGAEAEDGFSGGGSDDDGDWRRGESKRRAAPRAKRTATAAGGGTAESRQRPHQRRRAPEPPLHLQLQPGNAPVGRQAPSHRRARGPALQWRREWLQTTRPLPGLFVPQAGDECVLVRGAAAAPLLVRVLEAFPDFPRVGAEQMEATLDAPAAAAVGGGGAAVDTFVLLRLRLMPVATWGLGTIWRPIPAAAAAAATAAATAAAAPVIEHVFHPRCIEVLIQRSRFEAAVRRTPALSTRGASVAVPYVTDVGGWDEVAAWGAQHGGAVPVPRRLLELEGGDDDAAPAAAAVAPARRPTRATASGGSAADTDAIRAAPHAGLVTDSGGAAATARDADPWDRAYGYGCYDGDPPASPPLAADHFRSHLKYFEGTVAAVKGADSVEGAAVGGASAALAVRQTRRAAATQHGGIIADPPVAVVPPVLWESVGVTFIDETDRDARDVDGGGDSGAASAGDAAAAIDFMSPWDAELLLRANDGDVAADAAATIPRAVLSDAAAAYAAVTRFDLGVGGITPVQSPTGSAPLVPAAARRAIDAVRALAATAAAAPFLVAPPPDTPSYYATIASPMHLSLILARLLRGWYRSAAAVAADAQLIARNAAAYNVEGAPIVEAAGAVRDAVLRALE